MEETIIRFNLREMKRDLDILDLALRLIGFKLANQEEKIRDLLVRFKDEPK